MPRKQNSGLPSPAAQQQQMREQRIAAQQAKAKMMTKRAQDQMSYVQGSGGASSQDQAKAGVKQRSSAVDYSKARSSSYSGPSLDTLNSMLERAQSSGDAARIKRVKDQIAQAKKAGAK